MIGRAFAWTGRRTIAGVSYIRDISALIYFSFRELFRMSVRRRGAVFQVITRQILFTGLDALPVISAIALMLGLIIIVQAGTILPKVGAGDLLGTIIVVVLVRELGPILTAFVVIGRSGSAISTELGNMRVNLEVAALQAMGIRIMSFTIMPRLVGAILATICLTIYFDLVAIAGGFVVATFTLATPVGIFLESFEKSLSVWDVLVTILKGGLFGLAIAAICCHHGLSVQRSATEVPQQTSRAMLNSVIVMLLLDIIITVGVYF